MIHKPNPNGQWRLLVLKRQLRHVPGRGFVRLWLWQRDKRADAGFMYDRLWWYVRACYFVREGVLFGVRLVAPDGTVAAEEYANTTNEMAFPDIDLVKKPIRWPERWNVVGGRRLGTP